jgi:hypothetical protein
MICTCYYFNNSLIGPDRKRAFSTKVIKAKIFLDNSQWDRWKKAKNWLNVHNMLHELHMELEQSDRDR